MKEFEKQILLGSLLGDMSATKEFINARIEETHSVKQSDYLKWKLQNLPSIDAKIVTINDKTKNKIFYRLLSKTSPNLNWFHEKFYPSGKKTINKEILSLCKKTALAVWYCDDGDYDFENKSVSFHTEAFSKNKNQQIKSWFQKNLSLTGNLKKVRQKYFCFRLNVGSSDKFLNLVRPVIASMPDSMHYKLGHLDNKNVEKIKEFKQKKKLRSQFYNKREYVKIKNRTWAKRYYKKNKSKILKKIKSSAYKLKRKKYLKAYLKRPEVISRMKKVQASYRKTEKYRKWFREYQRQYRKKNSSKLGGNY